MKVGERLRERRVAARMSQSELARRLNLTQGTIAGLERGDSRSSTHLHRIARELGTTPAYLSGETDDPDADAPAERPLSADAHQLVDCFQELAPTDRASVLRHAMALAGRVQLAGPARERANA